MLNPVHLSRRIFRARPRSGAYGPRQEAASGRAELRVQSRQRGDTIVEVMVSIVVVSTILVAAYITTTHNINGLQDTQEHSEALQLAQAQVEHLHNSSAQSTWSNHSCFKTDGTVTNNAGCKVDASGTPTDGQPQFKVDITNDNPPTFKVAITWDSIDNPGVTNNVTLYYQP